MSAPRNSHRLTSNAVPVEAAASTTTLGSTRRDRPCSSRTRRLPQPVGPRAEPLLSGSSARSLEVVSTRGRPSDAQIRRGLAECMTLTNIDEAMDWEPGTARRRRWRGLDRGGLPSADAELGGVSIWFRSTIQHWRASLADHPASPNDDGNPPAHDDNQPSAAAGQPTQFVEAVPKTEEPDPELIDEIDEIDEGPTATPSSAEPDRVDDESGGERPGPAELPPSEELGPPAPSSDPTSTDDVRERSEDRDIESHEPAGRRSVASGYELDVGQEVTARLHGQWRDAVVVQRGRTTVAVDYRLDDTSLGARRQRISIERVRLPEHE
jgi:hypothetical protein